MLLANSVNLIDGDCHIRCQRDKAHHEEGRGVVRGGNGGQHVGELRDGHDEHDPERQRLRTVLKPCAALDEEGRDGAGEQQGEAAVGGVVGDAVVGVGEVPQVVGDNPEPQHIGPDHVLG